MDINLIRKANLQLLIDREYGLGTRGGKAEFARRMGKQADYISRCLYPPTKKGTKGVGEDLAREVELEFKLTKYALDQPRLGADIGEDGHADDVPQIDRDAAEHARRLALSASPRSRSALEKIAEAADSGLLREEDMVLLEMIANRLKNGATEATESPHQRLRKKLTKHDPIPQ